MNLLLDQGLPRSAIVHLQSAGIAAEHVGDLGMSAATDAEILGYAEARSLVVVTLDADFHHLLAAAKATAPSVIRLRVEGLKGEELAALLGKVLLAASDELQAGAAVSATTAQVRVHLLPIGT